MLRSPEALQCVPLETQSRGWGGPTDRIAVRWRADIIAHYPQGMTNRALAFACKLVAAQRKHGYDIGFRITVNQADGSTLPAILHTGATA
jgi:hypothetical protein